MRLYERKAWFWAIIVTFILFFHTSAFAQYEGIKGVQFNDGSIVYGRVVKMNVYDIQIETKDGKIISRKFDEVLTFIKDTDVDAKQESKPTAEGKVSQDKQVDKMLPAASAEPTEAGDIKQKSSAWEMGLIYSYFDYKEDLIPPLKSTENGWLPGFHFGYSFQKKSTIYTKVIFDYLAADITYDGSTSGGTPVVFSDQRARMLKFQWDVGYPVHMGKDFTLIPYIGYGYRYWARGESRDIPQYSAYFIKEIYQWHYLPVGCKAEYNITDRWTIGASVAANFMFNGTMTAYISDYYPGVDDIDFTLGNKVGFYAEVPITFRSKKNWAVVLTPWYEYSEFGQSETVNVTYGSSVIGYAYEPASKTNQYGLNLGVNFNF